MLRGEAGVGKSALLEYLGRQASRCTVARAAGVESEVEIAFAGLQQLCAPFADRLDRLPEPQRDALGVAFGIRGGDAPDRLLVGLAVLSLVSDVAEDRPLICIVDDVQWFDGASAQALVFVARRLGVESVGLVLAVREPAAEPHLEGLPELVVAGLDDHDARALLASVITGPLDERVRDRIVAETRGNPLALLELPRGRTPAELAGGFALGDSPALSGRIEESFRERLAPLPDPTRLLLLVAAAEPTGDPLLVWSAAAALGLDAGSAAPATATGLVEIGAQVRFGHPLVRSAVYRAAVPHDRQRVHRALADATDTELDPDCRAWHLAQATEGLDEDVAAELERSAGRARARAGLAAGAAFCERAAELTPDPRRRAQRALAAAQGKHHAGAADAALRLLATAEAGPLGDLERARAELLRAEIAFAATRGRDAPPLLLAAAKRLEPLDATLARETYLEAFAAALSADRLVGGGDAHEVAAAVLAADWEPSTRESDLLLDALALRFTNGCAAAAPGLKRALRAFRDEPVPKTTSCAGCGWRATSRGTWETTRRGTSSPPARSSSPAARVRSPCSPSPSTTASASSCCPAGSRSPRRCRARRTPSSRPPAANSSRRTAIALASWRGREAEARALTEARREDVLRRGEGLWLAANDWGTAVLYNGLGRYDEALAILERAAEGSDRSGLSMWLRSELIESAVRAGKADRAAEPLARLATIAEANGTEWSLGLYAARAAMLAEGDAAEQLYREAIERLSRTRIRIATARAQLLYGEWLRRENRRVDAREQLRLAREAFAEMGNEPFAERARRELLATGETVRKRTVETLDDLTPQETQIGRMAADGFTNPEIGAQLFLSPRTVEWHLRKVFGKLGISSRRELRTALPDVLAAVVPV